VSYFLRFLFSFNVFVFFLFFLAKSTISKKQKSHCQKFDLIRKLVMVVVIIYVSSLSLSYLILHFSFRFRPMCVILALFYINFY